MTTTHVVILVVSLLVIAYALIVAGRIVWRHR